MVGGGLIAVGRAIAQPRFDETDAAGERVRLASIERGVVQVGVGSCGCGDRVRDAKAERSDGHQRQGRGEFQPGAGLHAVP